MAILLKRLRSRDAIEMLLIDAQSASTPHRSTSVPRLPHMHPNLPEWRRHWEGHSPLDVLRSHALGARQPPQLAFQAIRSLHSH